MQVLQGGGFQVGGQRHHPSGAAEALQVFLAGFAPLFDQQLAQLVDGQVFGGFGAGHVKIIHEKRFYRGARRERGAEISHHRAHGEQVLDFLPNGRAKRTKPTRRSAALISRAVAILVWAAR